MRAHWYAGSVQNSGALTFPGGELKEHRGKCSVTGGDGVWPVSICKMVSRPD